MANLRGKASSPKKVVSAADFEKFLIVQEQELLIEQVEELQRQVIRNAILNLTWQETEIFVGGLMKAQSYFIKMTAKGPDMGSDIIATKDEFRLSGEKIKVEVKKRTKDKIGTPELRNFIGGLRHYHNGFFVSVSGFTKDAYLEAERSEFNITLFDLEELVKHTISKFDRLDRETKLLLKLKRIIMPLETLDKLLNPNSPEEE